MDHGQPYHNNSQKSHWVIIPPKKTTIPNLAIYLNNSVLAVNESEKYLELRSTTD